MEKDICNLARSLLSGYERRKRKYERDLDAIYALSAPSEKIVANYGGSTGGGISYTAQEIADMILGLENKLNTKCIRAVEYSKSFLTKRYGNKEADDIFKAIRLNAENGRKYNFNKLCKRYHLYMSYRTFYRLRDEIYEVITDRLDPI